MIKNMMMVVVLVGFAMAARADEPDHAIHEELRAVLKVVESAINSGDYDKMLPVLSKDIRATPINQEFLASRAEVSAYFKKWFGAEGYLKKLEISLMPDKLTELSADKNWGVVYGSGVERYILSDGRPYDLQTRWTATMVKEADGLWRIRTIHIATNFLDNPILTEAEHALGKAAAAGGAVGLLVGGGFGWWLRRKKKS